MGALISSRLSAREVSARRADDSQWSCTRRMSTGQAHGTTSDARDRALSSGPNPMSGNAKAAVPPCDVRRPAAEVARSSRECVV